MQPSQETPKDIKSIHSQQDSLHQTDSGIQESSKSEPEVLLEVSSGPRKTNDPITQQKSFTHSVVNTMQIPGDSGFGRRSIFYNEKDNMILACPYDNSVHFFDATTFLPFEGRKTQEVNSPVRNIAFEPETGTFLLSCDIENIYSYGISNQILKIAQEINPFYTHAEFIDSKSYFFGDENDQISIGNLEDESRIRLSLSQGSICSMKNLKKKRLLLASSAKGSFGIYRTDLLPKLPKLFSIGRDEYMASSEIHHLKINGKEYIITPGCDQKIRIWHLVKGKLGLLKVISMKQAVYSTVYLENYKMLAVTHRENFISFFSFPSGKFVKKIELNLERVESIFWMKDKNALGIGASEESKIQIIQLHSF